MTLNSSPALTRNGPFQATTKGSAEPATADGCEDVVGRGGRGRTARGSQRRRRGGAGAGPGARAGGSSPCGTAASAAALAPLACGSGAVEVGAAGAAGASVSLGTGGGAPVSGRRGAAAGAAGRRDGGGAAPGDGAPGIAPAADPTGSSRRGDSRTAASVPENTSRYRPSATPGLRTMRGVIDSTISRLAVGAAVVAEQLADHRQVPQARDRADAWCDPPPRSGRQDLRLAVAQAQHGRRVARADLVGQRALALRESP